MPTPTTHDVLCRYNENELYLCICTELHARADALTAGEPYPHRVINGHDALCRQAGEDYLSPCICAELRRRDILNAQHGKSMIR